MPMIVLVEKNGAYFYYVKDKSDTDGKLTHEWTELVPFLMPDALSDTEKKAYMADVLEDAASQIISNHNFIAGQYGINYRYTLPAFFQDMSREPEFPMIFVAFQGWPLDVSEEVFYENCFDAGVFLQEKTVY